MVSCSETLSPRITVVDHSPPDGAENVSPDSAIEVIFSYKINQCICPIKANCSKWKAHLLSFVIVLIRVGFGISHTRSRASKHI